MPRSAFPLTLALVLAAGQATLSFARVGLSPGGLEDNGRRLVVRAITYPTSGAQPCLVARDLPLVAAAGANTLLTRNVLPETDTAFLPALEASGLYWLAGFPLDSYYDPSRTITASRDRILGAFRSYAERLRGRSRLIGYVFGDRVTENYNSKFAGTPADFYALFAGVQAVLAEIEPEAPALVTTVTSETGELLRETPGLSFWAWRTGGPAAALPAVWTRPVLILEEGGDPLPESQTADAVVARVAGVETSGHFLGGVYAGFDDLFRSTPAGAYPRALATALAGRWGGRVPDAAARPPVLEAVEHAATGDSLASPGALVRVRGSGMTGGAVALCIGGLPAPVASVSPTTLIAQVPWELTPGVHPATLFCDGAPSNEFRARIDRFAPGVFPGAAVRAGTACSVSAANGVRPGEYLEVYGTGFGSETAAESGIEAFINGAAAAVPYLGLVPGFTGLNQANVQVPADAPPASSAGLFFRVGGAASNLYPLSVLGVSDKPGIALRADNPDILLQAGAGPGIVRVQVDGANGYCGPVLFYAEHAPAGISFRAPVGFTGQAVPVEIRAASGMSLDGAPFTLIGHAAGATSARIAIRLTVLPNQGDIRVQVTSGGYKSTPLSRFDWNGRTLFSTAGGGPGRGINVLPVNPATGSYGGVSTFDTWGDPAASERLAAYLAGLADGTIVLFSVADDGSLLLAPETRNLIAALFGSRFIGNLGYQESWALIGRKGAAAPISEHLSSNSQVILEKILTLPMQ